MPPRIRSSLHAGYAAVLDVLFPITCVTCGRGEAWLCEECIAQLCDFPARCIRCGTKSLHGRTCRPCQEHTPLTGVVTVGTYTDETLRTAIQAIKFGGVQDLAKPLASLLAPRVTAALGAALPSFIITPLPLHRRRERERGFNQARLLADALGKTVGIAIAELLLRTRATSPQTTIGAFAPDRRRENIADAFALRDDTATVPERVLLVDDVTTSGATLEEAARVLYAHGARDIWGAVVCKG